ncbi:N-6 DNA methylase [Streptomyces hundungensis]|uniref:Eco57I restriction-modification methylase domain-containing protein n=1 Tax=Streptomyces hundungensis TaxID=1077946 RepID=UPI0033EE8FBF
MKLIENTEARRVEALSVLDPLTQAALGQFFTPARAADLIASMPRLDALSNTVRILDPGAGVGSLTAALVTRLHEERPDLDVHVVAVDIDPQVMPYLRATLEECRATYGTTFDLVQGDYLTDDDALTDGAFDLVIANPPYAKLAAGSRQRTRTAHDLVDVSNTYAAFWARATAALAPGGQISIIVPRSWANGPYYRAFRQWMLDRTSLDLLHIFESRNTVFADTGVLQENVIVKGTRGDQQPQVVLSASVAHHDAPLRRTVPFDTVVLPGDRERFVRFDEPVVPPAVSFTLADLGLGVSTGKVVDFRNREHLTEDLSADGVVPMVYQANVRGGKIEWPQRPAKKPQGFSPGTEAARKLLLPEGHYVVIKRFTAKEEKRRVVAGVCQYDGPVALDNKTNYLHEKKGPLDPRLAHGLMLWLNSSTLDAIFRTFSGHTQVNAGDVKTLPFPSRDDLVRLAENAPEWLPEQTKLDALVADLFPAVVGSAE